MKRNDVVIERKIDSWRFYGRVWRRIDAEHVQVVMCGHYVRIYREEDLEVVDYKGCWKWGREPGNWRGKTPVWDPMPSLRKLKHYNQKYFAGFGGFSEWAGRRWTKEEIAEALADRTIHSVEEY